MTVLTLNPAGMRDGLYPGAHTFPGPSTFPDPGMSLTPSSPGTVTATPSTTGGLTLTPSP